MEKKEKEKRLRLLLSMNGRGKTLGQMAQRVGLTVQRVWMILHEDPRYVPGKKGFARLDKRSIRAISSKGGTAANLSGRTHRWNSATAKEASARSRAGK